MSEFTTRVTPKQGVLALLLVVLTFHPYLLANMGTETTLGLPVWYWLNMAILAVMLVVTYFLVNQIKNTSLPEDTTQSAEEVNF
jgi:uncharacterized protein (DUF983 family)